MNITMDITSELSDIKKILQQMLLRINNLEKEDKIMSPPLLPTKKLTKSKKLINNNIYFNSMEIIKNVGEQIFWIIGYNDDDKLNVERPILEINTSIDEINNMLSSKLSYIYFNNLKILEHKCIRTTHGWKLM